MPGKGRRAVERRGERLVPGRIKDDPDGLWVAEDRGDILGFAWSWVCGDVWFLAQLFVDPAQQGRGIGNELLKLTLEHGSRGKSHAMLTMTFVESSSILRHVAETQTARTARS